MRCISCVSSVILLVSRLFIISMYIFFRCPDISVIKENTFYYTCPSAPLLTSPGAFHCLRLICRDGRIPALLFFPLYGHRGEVLASAPLVKKKKFCQHHATFRKCSDNPQIPSSWITVVFYVSWRGAECAGNLLASDAAFHLPANLTSSSEKQPG